MTHEKKVAEKFKPAGRWLPIDCRKRGCKDCGPMCVCDQHFFEDAEPSFIWDYESGEISRDPDATAALWKAWVTS